MRIGIDNGTGTYVFTPGTAGNGTIQLIGCPYNVTLNQLQIIYNVTTGTPLFNFALSSLKASVSNNVITLLDVDTSSMNASDSLLIQMADDGGVATLSDILFQLKRMLVTLMNPQWVDKAANQVRAQVTGSISTVTTVTTVTTASNLSNIDSFSGRTLITHQNLSAWGQIVRSRIT